MTIAYQDLYSGRKFSDQQYRANASHVEVKPKEIIQQFGSWAVTKYGIECLSWHYPIEKKRLHEHHWLQHMKDKAWVRVDDFRRCLDAGRIYHSQPVRPESKATPTRLAPKPELNRPEPSPKRRDVFTGVFKHVTPKIRFLVFRRDGYRCQICGRNASDGVKLEVDHREPRAHGGVNTMSNLWTLCRECNIGKRTHEL